MLQVLLGYFFEFTQAISILNKFLSDCLTSCTYLFRMSSICIIKRLMDFTGCPKSWVLSKLMKIASEWTIITLPKYGIVPTSRKSSQCTELIPSKTWSETLYPSSKPIPTPTPCLSNNHRLEISCIEKMTVLGSDKRKGSSNYMPIILTKASYQGI